MKLSDLNTPKGRRAAGKLSLDLIKITGKVAVAGTVGLVGMLTGAVASTSFTDKTEEQPYTYDVGPDGPGEYDKMGFKVQNGDDWLD
ncbi:hypothetical protein FGL86_11475 [Pistricoccus aurantiacus]|uniref:Uncharacterized protein n=1 Tax=Pistricoccus aurantiacus TaxID=1883414 RepID=A0A5B8SXT7_9GAMM|nr:hypothetical protein [Pistricoccus aurantiacus]QEA39630.1 hypothetical protein FGL86_11475 [Pistricoccus aurantiacus]